MWDTSTRTCRRLTRKEEARKDRLNKEVSHIAMIADKEVSHIAMIADHLSSSTIMGELLRMTIEAAKVKIRVGRNLFCLGLQDL
jgi:hypothetical protein